MRHDPQIVPSQWQDNQAVQAVAASASPRLVPPLHMPNPSEAQVAPISYVRLGRLMVFLALFAFWAVVILTFI